MVDIRTSFVGLPLESPIVVSSSGLTRSVSRARTLVEAGAGAVVLKSLFEEQILMHTGHLIAHNDYPEAEDYISAYVRTEALDTYLSYVREAKEHLGVPIVASINCRGRESWTEFAQQIREAGADALEVNIMRLESDLYFDPIATEQTYIDIVQDLRSVGLPLIVKLSRQHTALPALVDKLRASGAAAVTLFNRTYQIDIDLDREQFVGGEVFSHQGDFTETLRYTGLIAGLVPGVEVAASTGIYTWQELAKSLLAGAQIAQMCTAIYKQGAPAIREALRGLHLWMQEHGYESIEELRGRLSYSAVPDPTLFERMQFMKYFSMRPH